MQKPFKWLLMLNKRLYKKAAFVTIMLFIPLCVFALGIAAEQQSGFVSIVLAREDNADPISTELVNSFMSEKSLVRFTLAASPAEAVSEVKSGGADAAWIFPTDMKSEIKKYAAIGSNKKPFIKVIEPILALGFVVHIVWASILTLQNQRFVADFVKFDFENISPKCFLRSG